MFSGKRHCYINYLNSESSDESVCIHRLTSDFTVSECNEFQVTAHIRGPDKEGFTDLFPEYLAYYPTKPYDVGTQTNRLIERIK